MHSIERRKSTFMIAINLCLITRFSLYNLTENRRVIIEVLGAYFIKLQNEKQKTELRKAEHIILITFHPLPLIHKSTISQTARQTDRQPASQTDRDSLFVS